MFVNIILFDDFETLDAFGPAEIFGKVPEHFCVRYLSVKGGIVNSTQGVKIWTEPLDTESICDVLVVPGGRGARRLLHMEPDTLASIKRAAQKADHCLMIANGSALLAQTGLLYHRKVADYPFDENWKRMFTAGITHVPDVRWLADGKFYSCSSSGASLDMSIGIIADIIDIDVALKVAELLDYKWDPEAEERVFL